MFSQFEQDQSSKMGKVTQKFEKVPKVPGMRNFAITKVSCIDQFPPAMLVKILSYIPNLRDAALVNKIFYQAVCDVDNERDIYKLVFDGGIDAPDIAAIHASIESSKRKVTEIEIERAVLDDDLYEAFLKIFDKFGPGIKKLTINRGVLDEGRLCVLLSFVKNIKEFTLTRSRLNRRYDPCINYTLKHLKKLDFSRTYCYEARGGKKRHTFFKELMSMITRGSPVEDLQADLNFLKNFEFEKKKLKCLALQVITPQNMRISTVIYSQYNLQSLDLLSCYFMDDVLLAIKNSIPDLKILKIVLTGITCNTFLQVVPKMKKLTELHIRAGQSRWITLAADEMSFPKIETLYLDVELLLITQTTFQLILEKFPKVQNLHVVTNYTEIINAIFENRLRMPVQKCTIQITNVQGIFPHGLSPKLSKCNFLLKELKIFNADADFAENADFSFLHHFLNLEKLIITGFILNSKLHQQALVPQHLAYLELAEFGQGSDYIIQNEPVGGMINKSRKLRVMKIECEKCLLSSQIEKQFPLIYRRSVDQVFRQR